MSILNWVFERSESLLDEACLQISKRLRDKRTFETEGSPYLSRFYLLRKSKPKPEADDDEPDRPFSVYLHYFHRGDEDHELHNHPWGWSFSIILTNGYLEERWTGREIVKRVLRPGSLNILRFNDFHRVDLRDPSKGAWTLFFAGKRVQDWGFWHPTIHTEYMPWREFIKEREANARQSLPN
jgi:hypothetical protein